MQKVARETRPRRSRVGRALEQELGRALRNLRTRRGLGDASIHEVRKELKRARASLRLLREEIGEAAYQGANRRLRNAARPLAPVRDAKALLKVAAKLRDQAKGVSQWREFDSLESELHGERRRIRQQLLEQPAKLQSIRNTIQSVRSDSREWRAPTDRSLRRAVERIYRKTRKAFARAESKPRNETLHELRKQSKYLGKALALLAPPTLRGRIARRARRAEVISDALGNDHDLAMLQQRLEARPRSGTAKEILARIEDRRRKLIRKATKRSRRLYRHRAKTFVDALDLRARAPGRE